jgi:mono/diheme cytochrome c family protein
MTKAGWQILVVASALVLSASAATVAQQETKKTVKRVPIAITSIASGEEMFVNYCAACHGKDGSGNGPAASAFKTPPSNLTVLRSKNDGKFPDSYVFQILQNGPGDTKAHGSKDMPVWGNLFQSIGGSAQTHQRIYNLTKYVESLQAGN